MMVKVRLRGAWPVSYSTDSDFYDFVFVFVSVFHDKYQSYKYEKHSREICYDCDGDDDDDDDDKYDGFQPGDPPPSDKIATSSTHGSSSS